MCWQRKIIVKVYFHAAVICWISKASRPGLSSYEPNCSILTQFSEANQKPAYNSEKYKINTMGECGDPLHNVCKLKISIHKWTSHPTDQKDILMPQWAMFHMGTVCVDLHTHTHIHHVYTMASCSWIKWSPVRELSALLDALQMGLVVMWALLTAAVKMQNAVTQWEHLTIQLDTQTDRNMQHAS